MAIRINFLYRSNNLKVYNDQGRLTIEVFAQLIRFPLFPPIGNTTYQYAGQRADQSLSVFPFHGPSHGNPRDVIYLTYSPSLVQDREGGILVMNVRVATLRELSGLLARSQGIPILTVGWDEPPQSPFPRP